MRRRLLEVTLLFSALLAIYLANGRTLGSGDTLPARYLPLSLLREGTFYLDSYPFLYDDGAAGERRGHLPYYVMRSKGHYVSWYPVGAPLLAVPVYLPAVLAGISPESPGLAVLEKLAAAIIVGLSAVLLYLVLLRFTTRLVALALVAVYALGTSNFSISSQALWQHGPSQLALTAGLYCLVRGRDEPRWLSLAGLAIAFAVVVRPPNALLALCLAAYVACQHPRHAAAFALGTLPSVVFQLWYNVVYLGDPFHTQLTALGDPVWRTPLLEGLAGLLASPGRGLLVYSPVVLLAGLGLARAWQPGGDRLLRMSSVGVVLTIVLYSKWAKWWGGYTYGPRLLADLSPVFALGILPLADDLRRRRAWQVALLVLAAWSIGAHAIGAFVDDHIAWNWRVDVEAHPERLWWWGDNQLVNGVRRLWDR